MTQFEAVKHVTRHERETLQSLPIIRRALVGDITRETYLRFLTEAYHHVRHTVPLLMALGSRLTARQRWLQKPIIHYLEEEVGHDEWILADISATGGDAARVRESAPNVETDSMVAYAYDVVMRREPTGFFGMVLVLEGTSAALALSAANAIQDTLKLPERAFTYLRSHGKLDQEHIGELESVINRLEPERELPAVITCARTMYSLYANVFRGLESSGAESVSQLDTRRRTCA